MNNDLISRSALLQIYKCWLPQLTEPEDAGDRNGVETCIAVLKAAPAVDAEPVRHGRWVENIVEDARACPPYSYKNGYKCSLCDRITRTNSEPYCHCGAKMDAEAEE